MRNEGKSLFALSLNLICCITVIESFTVIIKEEGQVGVALGTH